MDPISGLNLKKDSTLALIRAAKNKDWKISYLLQNDLYFDKNRPMGMLKPLKLLEPFVEHLDPTCINGPWYELGEEQATPLDQLSAIFMRKDPPFNMEYIYTTYLLERAEETGVLVVNRPKSLRDCNEKFFATAFPETNPSLIVTSREDLLREFTHRHKNVVMKKLDGMGGKSVFRIMEGDHNLGVVIETLTDDGRQPIMAQLYLPEISQGDKRILMIDGEPVPYALARVPMAGEARGNLAAGGTGEGRELSERDRWIARQLGPELRSRGLYFVGIDIIGDFLTEINVTCPTCIRELDAQFSLDIGADVMRSIESRIV